MCLSCANSIFPFHSLANNELSDLFNEGFLSKISVELNNQFSNQPNNGLNFNNTDKNDTLLDILLNDTYFTTQEINQSFNKNENKTFFTMCLNLRSLVNPHNFNKLECLILELQIKPDIIAINKTWEKPSSSGQYKNLNGYNFISNPRLKSGGGVGMYIKNTLVFSLCSELSIIKEKIFEFLFIKVHFKNKSIVCGTVYRPPRQDKSSIDSFNNSLVLNVLISFITKY